MKLGFVALDGTRMKANASKHRAMSYGRMVKKDKELAREVEKLLKQAEALDEQEDKKYGKGKEAMDCRRSCDSEGSDFKDQRSQASA